MFIVDEKNAEINHHGGGNFVGDRVDQGVGIEFIVV